MDPKNLNEISILIFPNLLRRECVVVINAVIVASSSSFNGDLSYDIQASRDCENGVFFVD